MLDDLSLVETHDCFTIAELIEYEAMGLTRAGKAQGAARGLGAEGWASAGEPVRRPQGQGASCGATGVSMHVMACMQLAGEAAGMQIPGAALAGVFNMGGAAVANYVSILERAK